MVNDIPITFAVVRRRTVGDADDFVVRLYDKRKPLNPSAGDPCARYEYLTTIGPFGSELEAAREAKRTTAL